MISCVCDVWGCAQARELEQPSRRGAAPVEAGGQVLAGGSSTHGSMGGAAASPRELQLTGGPLRLGGGGAAAAAAAASHHPRVGSRQRLRGGDDDGATGGAHGRGAEGVSAAQQMMARRRRGGGRRPRREGGSDEDGDGGRGGGGADARRPLPSPVADDHGESLRIGDASEGSARRPGRGRRQSAPLGDARARRGFGGQGGGAVNEALASGAVGSVEGGRRQRGGVGTELEVTASAHALLVVGPHGGESFLRVHWVAVPEAMCARRANRRRRGGGGGTPPPGRLVAPCRRAGGTAAHCVRLGLVG
jgi:hypothetical protein